MRTLSFGLCLMATVSCAGPDASKRPVPRPDPAPVATEGSGLGWSLRPFLRSNEAAKTARTQRKLLERGAVCGDLAIQGEAIGRVSGRISACGIEDAVRVSAVSGVGLSTQAVMDCTTARALKTWLDDSAKPALAKKGGGLSQIKVAAHYICRTRNNKKGGKISEHGKGRAIDISAFRLKDGSAFSVLNGWNAKSSSKALRQMHKGACGPFGTVLGPNADRHHRDHFHFDTARYRSGSYCR
ncbi:hypothetical protein C1J03_04370 [Sulfitobacter sp. SK012]|uniref:extensin-like domain-containing protein n=1 Tax=Sulfitobacter sp. SK012 TaxID=1389005 RepID=UPI000E0B16DA|nr:extensin family protein [Sulfitobacter sp. SK012]AXI45340.1 hypothetical protein C1J03_04370 [Sulfitobacter sp. SK012]